MVAELDNYKAHLMTLSPYEILQNAYEYVLKQDILLSLEYNDLSASGAKAMLRSPTPLEDIYHKWEHRENSHMEDIWDTFETHADEKAKEHKEKRQHER